MQTKVNVRFIATSAVIAAAYVALSLLSAAFGLAFGPVQFRLSELLCILPVFTPAAIPGLFVGCVITNIMSFSPLDIIFGSLATLTAALLTYFLRNVKVKGLPIFSFFPPILVNALIVGAEVALFFMPDTAFFTAFAITGFQVAIGQTAVCLILGIPFFYAMKKVRF